MRVVLPGYGSSFMIDQCLINDRHDGHDASLPSHLHRRGAAGTSGGPTAVSKFSPAGMPNVERRGGDGGWLGVFRPDLCRPPPQQ